MYRKLADDGVKLMRRSQYLHSCNRSTDHLGVLIQDCDDGLMHRRISLKQLDERRGEAICPDKDDALAAIMVVQRLLVFAKDHAHNDPGCDKPACQQQTMCERHWTWNALETSDREQRYEGHELGKEGRFGDIERLVHRKITGHAILEPQGDEGYQRKPR